MFPHMSPKPVMPLHSGGRVPVSLFSATTLQQSKVSGSVRVFNLGYVSICS